MIVSINQPAYLPWLGYFDRIAKSDIHVVLDHVQFEKNSVTNRNKLRTPSGWAWLTMPVKTSGRFGNLPISEIEVENGAHWARKHLQALRSNYGQARYFREHFGFFETVYGDDWGRLSPRIQDITQHLLRAFGIRTKVIYSSAIDVRSSKGELIMDICGILGATEYISGPFGRDYLNPDDFHAAGIRLSFHDYRHPSYQQAFPGFEPYMAAVDLLFNHGPDSLSILSRDQELVAA